MSKDRNITFLCFAPKSNSCSIPFRYYTLSSSASHRNPKTPGELPAQSHPKTPKTLGFFLDFFFFPFFWSFVSTVRDSGDGHNPSGTYRIRPVEWEGSYSHSSRRF
ncbi:hypothetical protein K402DRAFT_395460 [Aulographum hederae CBS 113979]|uniref:Uncharacterized protein n=1 Tax=Aulographum hederae CBS 113979 TaxID=1176131 RepID=A0A6G1GVD9_9PEZI|nr:hypothetical protein K402DRAFT_395460 [Aulographum hederae CBS 113979]